MKNLKQIITVVAMAIFMLSSFSGVAQENNPYNEYGIEHNRYLDYFYTKVSEVDKRDRKNINSTNFFVEITTQYFTEETKLNKKDIPNDIKYFLNKVIEFPPKSTGPTFPEKANFDEETMKLAQKVYNLTLKNNLIGLKEIIKDVNESELNENDKIFILVLTSIGYNSLEYWTSNGDKWLALSNNQGKAPPPWAHIGAADVGAGIVGAVVGGTVSVGVLAVPGWIVGAASGSAAQGCVELVDWLWG